MPPAPATEKTPLLTGQAPPGSIALQVEPQSNSQPRRENLGRAIQWSRVLEFIWPYISPKQFRLRFYFTISIVFVVISKFCNLLPPIALKWAVDILADNDTKSKDAIIVPLMAILVYLLGGLGNAGFKALQGLSYAVVTAEQTMAFSVNVFSHLQHLDVTYHMGRKTGEISRITERGAESIETLMKVVMYTLLPTLFEATLVFGVFLKLGAPVIAFVTIVSVILYGVFTKVVTDMRIKLRRRVINADNAVKQKEVDTLINYETVKMFGMESFEIGSYNELQTEYKDASLTFYYTLQILNFGQTAIRVSGASLSLVLAAYGAARGNLTPGDFVMISTFIAQLFQPLAFLGESYRIIVRASTDIEKCITLFDTKPTVVDKENATQLIIPEQELIEKRKGEIVFDNVSFTYKTADRTTGGIRNLSFSVRPGQMLGVVGSSGAGKSTLIRLVVRFYDPDEGRVLIDGVDVKEYTQESIRTTFGVVAQDTSLFNETMRYNIAYGKIDATDNQLYKAIEAAQLKEFVGKLPTKLETVVGERGVRLSGGERQRVGVARCIVRSPIFVLLDEASSSLDSETEREMQEAIQEICRGRTTIAVAHRLSTVMMADEIIVLDEGRIIERGTHDELLALHGKYYSMWMAQTEGQSSNGKHKAVYTNATSAMNGLNI